MLLIHILFLLDIGFCKPWIIAIVMLSILIFCPYRMKLNEFAVYRPIRLKNYKFDSSYFLIANYNCYSYKYYGRNHTNNK